MDDDATMRAALLIAEGAPVDALQVARVPRPEPGAGEVRVAITHAALNHLDLWIRRGMPSVPKPRIPGADGTGVIDAVGAGDAAAVLARTGLRRGDRVVLDPGSSCGACPACDQGETSLCAQFRVLGEHRSGTLAEAVVVPATAVHAVPAHLSDPEAAALTLVTATAWRMLFTRAGLRQGSGERVLVWGASSGVGCAALQLCAAAGLETLATTRTADKVDALCALGADHVVVTGDGDDAGERVQSAVTDAWGTEGVDVAFDHLGAVAWGTSMRVLRRGGRYVTCGATTGARPPADITRLFWKQLSMLGSTMASRSDVADVLAFVAEHRIVPRIAATFDLDDVAGAHAALEGGAGVGKIVLRTTA